MGVYLFGFAVVLSRFGDFGFLILGFVDWCLYVVVLKLGLELV